MLDYDEDTRYVLILGLIGAGKTTFVEHIMKSGERSVGNGMGSGTESTVYSHQDIDGEHFVFIDTPGFDDPKRSNADILVDLTTWIGMFLGGRKITAVLYFHDITTAKLHGSAERNFAMFSKLIGSDAMRNVGLVSTHWDAVPVNVATDREKYLKNGLWKIMTIQGAKTYRLKNDYDSCHALVKDFMRKRPVFTKIQTELSEEGYHLSETDAGASLVSEVEARIVAQKETVEYLTKLLSKPRLWDQDGRDERMEVVEELEKSERILAQFEVDLSKVKKVEEVQEVEEVEEVEELPELPEIPPPPPPPAPRTWKESLSSAPTNVLDLISSIVGGIGSLVLGPNTPVPGHD